MYDDVESDFWKDVFVHVLHRNMVRAGAERLTLSECPAAFEEFQKKHPSLRPEITNSSSYTTWEVYLTPSIKIRLFIQSQIKGSLLQKNGNELVKIADARFPYNPFPEIESMLENRGQYEQELAKLKDENLRIKKQQKIAGEFIKALLEKKFSGKDVVYYLNENKNDFSLVLVKQGEQKEYRLSIKDFKNQINSL